MNIEYLTPDKWEVLRKMDYDTLMKFREMFQPLEDEDEF